MYNISDFLLVPAWNKMYMGAVRVHFILLTSKKSEMFYIIYLNVVGAIHFLQLQKINVLHGSKKYGFRTDLFTPKAILFNPCR